MDRKNQVTFIKYVVYLKKSSTIEGIILVLIQDMRLNIWNSYEQNPFTAKVNEV